jgi:hypothetical protein
LKHQWHPHLSYHPVSEHTLEHHSLGSLIDRPTDWLKNTL